MKAYLWQRIFQFIPLLLGISLLTFFVINLAPGEPTALLMDPKIPPEELLRIKANLGLDQPLWVQYFIWLKNILTGHWGYSYVTAKPVLLAIVERIPATFLLMFAAFLLNLIISIPMGIYSALKKDQVFDRWVTVLSFMGMSIPGFWLALMLMLLFSLTLGWLPSSGMLSPHLLEAPFYLKGLDILKHMILPVAE